MHLRIRNLFDSIVRRHGDLAAPLAAAVRAVLGDRRRRFGLLVAGGTSGLLLVVAILLNREARESSAHGAAADAWRYLVICDACGRRQHVQDLPTPHGVQMCDACGKGRLTSYRRGSQALIPGGWSASMPTATTRPSEDGS